MAKRVFFSFHYQDVADFRANIVRNHKMTKHEGAGYFDASIWESSKKESDLALKRLINSGLENTSVTSVLVGSQTFNRRWVSYEIMKSMQKGNKIIAVHINGIKDKDGNIKGNGPNPLNYLGYKFSEDGRKIDLYDYVDNKWIKYTDLDSYTLKNVASEDKRGKIYKLSSDYPIYDWVADNGYDDFEKWIE